MATRALELGNGTRMQTFAFYVPFLGNPWVFLGDMEDSKAILQEHFQSFPKGELGERLQVFLGRGIFAADGDRWAFQRKSASHLFKVRELKQMSAVFDAHLDDLVEVFAASQGSSVVDLQQIFSNYTFDCFSEIAYGVNFNSLTTPSVNKTLSPLLEPSNSLLLGLLQRF